MTQAKFIEAYPAQGFDADSPQYQMVPAGDIRYVRLIHGAGMEVRSSDNSIVDLVEQDTGLSSAFGNPEKLKKLNDRFFKLTGGRADVVRSARVLAEGSSGKAKLNISVRPYRWQRVMFNICYDEHGHRATIDNEAAVGKYIRKAQDIWLKQANVGIVNQGIGWKMVPENLGDTIRFADRRKNGTTPMMDKFADMRQLGVNFNVFFVWEIEDGNRSPDLGSSPRSCWASRLLR